MARICNFEYLNNTVRYFGLSNNCFYTINLKIPDLGLQHILPSKPYTLFLTTPDNVSLSL
jgi:hypothetical protein